MQLQLPSQLPSCRDVSLKRLITWNVWLHNIYIKFRRDAIYRVCYIMYVWYIMISFYTGDAINGRLYDFIIYISNSVETRPAYRQAGLSRVNCVMCNIWFFYHIFIINILLYKMFSIHSIINYLSSFRYIPYNSIIIIQNGNHVMLITYPIIHNFKIVFNIYLVIIHE